MTVEVTLPMEYLVSGEIVLDKKYLTINLMKNFITGNQEIYDKLSNIYEFSINLLLYGSALTAMTGYLINFNNLLIIKGNSNAM